MSDATPKPKAKANYWLLEHKKNITSQFGEDGIIEKIFEIIPDLNRWCVEFGAGNGHHLSNTFNLIFNKNWFSVQIEASPDQYLILCDRYVNNQNVICLNQIVGFEGSNSLDSILATTPTPKDLDFLSIDVDGNDYHIWDSLQDFRPKVVLVEFNVTIPHYISYIQPKDMEVFQGSSLAALVELGKSKGYELIVSTGCNAFFVDKKYFSLFEIEDNSIWTINQDFRYITYVFQLYDGTIVVGGNNRLLWHNIELDLDEIQELVQVLPPEERGYPERPMR